MTQTVNVRKVIEIDVKASKDAADAVKKMASQMGTIEEHAKKGSGAMTKMFGLMRAGVHLFVFSEIANVVKTLVLNINELNDKASIAVKRFEQITGSTTTAKRAFNDIIDVSVRQGQAFDGVAKLYEKAARNADAWGITMEGARQITDGFSASLRLSGANTQESYAALVQFGQVLASGKFQGDEFRSMMENNATFMYELAAASGKTVGELRKLGTDGKLGPEFLREAMFKMGADGMNMLERLGKKAAELPMTFGQSMNGVKSALVEFVESLQGTADKTEGFLTTLSKGFTQWLREKSAQLRAQTEIQEAIRRAIDEAEGRGLKPAQKTTDEEAAAYLSSRLEWYGDRVRQGEERIARWERISGRKPAEDSSLMRQFKADVAAANDVNRQLNALWDKMLKSNAPPVDPNSTTKITPKNPTTKTPQDPLAQLKDQLASYQADYARMFAEPLDSVSDRMSKFHEWLAKKPEIAVLKEAKPFVDAIESMIVVMDQADGAAQAVEKGLSFMKEEMKDDIKAINDLDKLLSKIAKDNPILKLQAQIDEIDNAMMAPAIDSNRLAVLAEGRADLVDKLWKAVREGTKEAGDEAETTAKRIEKAFDKAAGSMSDSLVDFVMGTKSSFGDLVVSILADFAKAEARILLSPIMKAASKGISDWVGGLFADTPRTTGDFARADRMLPSAKGNAFIDGVHAFAKGGIIDQPVFFGYGGGVGLAGEAGTEVVAPLKRGRDGEMGVAAVAPVVQIVNNSRAQIRTEEGETPDGAKQLRVFVEDAVDTAFGSGRFDRTLSTLYGVGRKGR